MLTGKDRDDWIAVRLQRVKTRNRIGNFLVLGALGWFVIAVEVPSFDLPWRVSLSQVFAGLALVSLFAGVYVGGSAVRSLPPVEDRALFALKSAVVNLRAYATHGDDASKRRAIEDLGRVADIIDSWTWGNLAFIREGVGKEIVEFQKNFRGRLIPAIANSNKTSIQSFFMSLTGVENAFEMGQLDQRHLGSWNQWLTARRTPDLQEIFPYVPPRQSRLARLRSKKFHLTLGLLIGVSPFIAGIASLDILHTTVDTAVLAATSTFTGVALAVVGLLALGRQKPS